MSKLKTTPNDGDVNAFINAVEDDAKREDSKKILALMEEVTGVSPKMWGKSIVGFDSYHYKYASGREGDWMMMGFSPRRQNLTLYIMNGFGRYEELMAKLGKYKTGKSCLYIKRLADVDKSVLKDLMLASINYMRDKYNG